MMGGVGEGRLITVPYPIRSTSKSFLPALGITLGMKHSKNNNAGGINREQHLVGELSRECAPGTLIDDFKRLGITR